MSRRAGAKHPETDINEQAMEKIPFPFDNSYARLPERFYARQNPTAVPAPRLIRLNRGLASDIGLDPDALESHEGAEIFAGNRVPEGALPIAMAYAGHQFGHWVPELGDGRAVLLGELIDLHGERRDIQLKGAGRTAFSRHGDGRAALGPVLREYIVSEAMAALGVPTTRALAIATTGEEIRRETMLPGAILTRVARSHIRIGTFQYFAARGDIAALTQLADYAIARHYPHAREAENPYRAFLDAVIERQAGLIAKWVLVGFIHGVMNTDNMSIAGETIDYGPCAFMDHYHPGTVFSSIDHRGRYAYGNQPPVAQWNLACLARTLLPLLDADDEAANEEAETAVARFPALFETAWIRGMREKLGLEDAHPADMTLAQDFLNAMAENKTDFTLAFRRLSDLKNGETGDDAPFHALFEHPGAIDDWLKQWRIRLSQEGRCETNRNQAMHRVNPAYIPRNHLIEEAIDAAGQDDFQAFEELTAVLSNPFEAQSVGHKYGNPPRPDQIVHETFCGT